MKLASAVVCLSCDEVFNEDVYKCCPVCADTHPLHLLPILKPIKEMPENQPNVISISKSIA